MLPTENAPVFAVGALNLDIIGFPDAAYSPRDSIPGRIAMRPGGVAHNIARQLASEGVPVELVTMLGDDYAAKVLTGACLGAGIGLTHAIRHDGPSSAYQAIHDDSGDMVAAINDMRLLDAFGPEQLSPVLPAMRAAPLVIADANPPQATLRLLAESLSVPLLLDPVSGVKAQRVRPFLGRFTAIKPNRLEAASLSGEDDPARAAAWLLRQGVRQVFVSLGVDGVYYAEEGAQGYLPATPMHAPDCTGAGDVMAAGIALGMLRGLDAHGCAQSGISLVTRHLIQQGGTLL